MPIFAITQAAKAVSALYSIVLAGSMTYFVVQHVKDDRKRRKKEDEVKESA